ncbi:hypothetical protein LJB88_01200 [Erysipelotrichaceae bacterium OttesenSCG-928-M19]|nr:hypothetical protein [Erysipelotrichaceae bacterium OttesenSCG-928-M19]
MSMPELDKEIFVPNKPSVIDLYTEDNMSIDDIETNLKNNHLFKKMSFKKVKDNILEVTVEYKANTFRIYFKNISNEKCDLSKINKVLVNSESIAKAQQCKTYLKSYIKTTSHYLDAYYCQIKMLALLSKCPILIVDCTQWCIYSSAYISQFLKYDVDIVDSNLFKVKYLKPGTFYTEGLERFGIKDIEMSSIPTMYHRACAAFLSRLARFFIEKGQLENTCKAYTEVFEFPFYACIINIDEIIDNLKSLEIVNSNRDEALNTNRLFVTVHKTSDIENWYYNDEEVLKYLLETDTYYTSQKHFNDEMKLAQLTIRDTIDFISSIDDSHNLMILARNAEISTDWYYFSKIENDIITLKTNEKILEVEIKDVLNWNYRGVTPLYAYSLGD